MEKEFNNCRFISLVKEDIADINIYLQIDNKMVWKNTVLNNFFFYIYLYLLLIPQLQYFFSGL